LTVQGLLVTVVSACRFQQGYPHLPRIFLPLLLAFSLLSGAVVSGCAGAPVQEMSNARQAVRAAEHAGAAAVAPEVMGEAKELLKSAESHLRRGDYRSARDEAELARTKAVEARSLAETAKASHQP
jgi:Domain of unknown function (DUF4398)